MFDLEDVRKDEECTDTVGVFVKVDRATRAVHVRITLGRQVQTLTRAMTAILFKGFEGATPEAILEVSGFCAEDRRWTACPPAQPDRLLSPHAHQERRQGLAEPRTRSRLGSASVAFRWSGWGIFSDPIAGEPENCVGQL